MPAVNLVRGLVDSRLYGDQREKRSLEESDNVPIIGSWEGSQIFKSKGTYWNYDLSQFTDKADTAGAGLSNGSGNKDLPTRESPFKATVQLAHPQVTQARQLESCFTPSLQTEA
ncbi:uncharacterized protein L3040_007922 [Drepanopeziza brunnea f. sp. 'multigermtubi']|uniref:uncharacterized protein n=1 Tax=Drepanopeziza brunnea f. sp. 'multigermtubi' TaxID=698441 RepID=UPI0023856C89|nr:hypothetical protein L3040_007922 [Drepanopeziza brunnea f. sp. 'multigermtubi']